MTEFLTTMRGVFTLTFAVSTMFGLGLRVTLSEILAAMSNARLLITALVANFVIVPLAALVLSALLLSDPALRAGLILISTAAGAPLIPKLAEIARGSIRVATGLVVLLLVGTVVYMPIVLPLVLEGIAVNPLAIAQPLFLQIVLPLVVGLIVAYRYGDEQAA